MEYTDVINHWNMKKGKKWRHVRIAESSYSNERIRKEIIAWKKRGLSYEHLCIAIDNYALILLNYDYKWSHSWTLLQLLTRHRPDDRKIFQLERFIPGEFVAYDYMKPEARLREHRQHKQQFPQKVTPKFKTVPSVVVNVNDRRNTQKDKLGIR